VGCGCNSKWCHPAFICLFKAWGAREPHDCRDNPARRERAARHARRLREILREPAGGTGPGWLERELER
jgi:hypothetical protein